MSERSAFAAGLNQASGALNVYALEAQVAAFNIANVSTSSFKPARAEVASGPQDKGVRLSALKREGEESASIDSERLSAADNALNASGTDLAKEFIHLIEAKNSFIANAKVIGVIDETSESLLNIKT